MLCEVSVFGVDLFGNLFATWLFASLLGVISIFGLSGVTFWYLYARPTFATWQAKSNPNYPDTFKVRDEIRQTVKGVFVATLCPSLSLWLTRHGYSQAYCGVGEETGGYTYLVATFFLTWLGTDFWEFLYHRWGHVYSVFWQAHKHHHVFFNPTPFAVIADEYVDQIARVLPMVVFPMLLPINVDMLFLQYGVFFYLYGCYLHTGHELSYPDAHHPLLNTSFQHYAHHAKSVIGKPYHTGFYFKFWDVMWGSVWKDECFCAKCERAKGLRSKERWEKIKPTIPDYSVLLQPSFWLKSHQ